MAESRRGVAAQCRWVAILVVGFTVSASAVPAAGGETVSVSTEIVDARRWFELAPQGAAMDADGGVHITYGKDSLYYAFSDGSGWTTQVADVSPGVGASAAIALDSEGVPHIAYVDQVNGLLKMAVLEGEFWRTNTVGVAGVFAGVAIAIDAADVVHVAYEARDGGIIYGQELDGWAVTPVREVTPGIGPLIQLLLDSAGLPHIVYISNADGHVWHASSDGQGWTAEDVTPHANAWGQSAALDGKGELHISYRNGSTLEYAVHTLGEGAWTYDTVATDCNPAYSSVAVDDAGVPRIAYLDWWTSELKLATKLGTAWFVADVADGRAPGQVCAVGSDGVPWLVSCAGYDACELCALSWDGHTWTQEVVDAGVYVGRESALVIDTEGQTWIAYPAGDRAVVAVLEEAGWRIDYESEAFLEVEGFTLDTDPDGHLVVAYTRGRYTGDWPYPDWAYDTVIARRVPEGWTEEVVWSVEESNQPFRASMAIAPDGTIGVAHFEYPDRLLFSTLQPGGEWIHRTIARAPGFHVWHTVSLAAGPDGQFHMADAAYVNETDQTTLHYRAGEDMEHDEVVIGSDEGYAGMPSLVIGPDGHITIVYTKVEDLDEFDTRVWFAERQDDGWQHHPLDALEVNYLGGLALDAVGDLHVAYMSAEYFDPEMPSATSVMYGWQDGEGWHTVKLFDGVDVYPTSIALDPSGEIVVAYHDFRLGDALLARIREQE